MTETPIEPAVLMALHGLALIVGFAVNIAWDRKEKTPPVWYSIDYRKLRTQTARHWRPQFRLIIGGKKQA